MTKILIRSQVLDLIYRLKSSRNFSDRSVEAVIEELKNINNFDFLFSVLLKEINCQDVEFDCVIILILTKINAELLQEQIWELLSVKTISDKKKLFLINVLRDLGAKVDYNQIQEFVSNPDEIVDLETKNFLQVAKVNPEAQIDFLDFFFTVSDADQNILLTSIIEDFASDELANVVAPIIYFNPSASIIPVCIEALKQSKSYLAFEPLNWILDNVEDLKLKQLAKKAINELKLMGLRQTFSKTELFKDVLKASTPIGYWASMVDGADNFSLIFARQKNPDEISTFFTVVNLKRGASACFGFDAIIFDEFEKILKRFFATSYMIPLDIKVGQRLLNDSILNSQNTPYELLCWRSLTYDIEQFEDDVDKYFSENLISVPINDFEFRQLLQGNYIDNWFFKKGECEYFDKIIDKICAKEPSIDAMLDIIKNNPLPSDIFDKRLLYQAYFLSQIEKDNVANLLYSFIEPSAYKDKLFDHIIKKSIYQHFLELTATVDKGNVRTFGKKEKKNNVDAAKFVNIIEDEWTK